jgi:hypothetical protein
MNESMNDGLRAAIREQLKKDHVSFAELTRIPGFNGNLTLVSKIIPNVIFWSGLSEEACDVLDQLQDAGEYHLHGCSMLVYFADGSALKMPIAKKKVQYKTPHWLPCVLKRGPGPCHEKNCPRRSEQRRRK